MPRTRLFPPEPRVPADEVAASYHAWNRSVVGDPDRQRAVQPRHRPLDRRPAAADQRRARASPSATSRPACPWFTTLFGRDSLIASFQALRVPAPARASRRSRSSPRSRRPRRRPGATPSRARSCTSCGRARWPAPASCRTGRTTARSTPRRCGWSLLAAHVRLDRRPGARRPAVAERARARCDWIDTLRRPRRRRVRRVRAADAVAASQPGLEGLGRRRSATGTGQLAPTPDRAGRGPGLRVRRQAPAGRASRACAATRTSRTRLEADAETLRRRFEESFWSRTSVTTRWRSTARSGSRTRSRRTPATACGPGSSRPTGPGDVVDRLMAPDMFSGWGIRTYAAGQPGYNPIGYHTGTVWPHDMSLIAAGLQALRLPRRGEPARRPDLRGGAALRRLPAARAVLRLRPRPLAGPRPVPGRLLAAGVGGRLAVPVPRDDARACAPHADRRELELRAPGAARLAAARSRSRTCASATAPWTCCSIAGAAATSAEVLRKSRRPRRHDPDLAPWPTPHRPWPSSSRVATERIAASGSGSPRLDAELLLGQTLGRGPDGDPRPRRRARRAGRAARRSRRPSSAASAASPSPTSAASASSTGSPSRPTPAR